MVGMKESPTGLVGQVYLTRLFGVTKPFERARGAASRPRTRTTISGERLPG